MVVVYNTLGLATVILSGVAAAIIMTVFGIEKSVPIALVAGPVMSTVDTICRVRSGSMHWGSSEYGGTLFWIPVYVCVGCSRCTVFTISSSASKYRPSRNLDPHGFVFRGVGIIGGACARH